MSNKSACIRNNLFIMYIIVSTANVRSNLKYFDSCEIGASNLAELLIERSETIWEADLDAKINTYQ